MTDKTEGIKIFFDAFRKLQKFIDEYCRGEFEFEGLILSCCYLDSLAGYKYGGKSSGQRFSKFINEYSGKKECWTKIALPILLQDIPKLGIDSKLSTRLKRFLNQGMKVRPANYTKYGHNVDTDWHSLEEQLRREFTSDEVESLKRKIEYYQYSYLLWQNYRNPAIHETAKRNHANNIAGAKEPYYHGGYSKVRFGIPEEFIFETLQNCISNFEKECVEKQWDPILDKE